MPSYAPEGLLLLGDGVDNTEGGSSAGDEGGAEVMGYEMDTSYEPLEDEMERDEESTADAKEESGLRGEDAMEVEDDAEQPEEPPAAGDTSEPVTAVSSSSVQVSPALQLSLQDDNTEPGKDGNAATGMTERGEAAGAVGLHRDHALEIFSSAAAPHMEYGEVTEDDLHLVEKEKSEQPPALQNLPTSKPEHGAFLNEEGKEEGLEGSKPEAPLAKQNEVTALLTLVSAEQEATQQEGIAYSSGKNASKTVSTPATPQAGRDAPLTPATVPEEPREQKNPTSVKSCNQARSKKESTPKKTAPKKRKAFFEPGGIDSSDELESSPPRRSKRIKRELFPQQKRFADDAEMTHFEMIPHSSANTKTTTSAKMRCKRCQREFVASRARAKTHLEVCLEAEEKVPASIKNESQSTVIHISTRRQDTSSCSNKEVVSPSGPAEAQLKGSGHEQLVWLMGSPEDADALKACFQKKLLVIHAPISRFQELVADNSVGLRGLCVKKLLEAVDHGEIPVAMMLPHEPRRRRTGEQRVDSLQAAEMLHSLDFALRFAAPRSVAERFTVPLAKAVGLSYAAHRHTATIVSCPQPGVVLLDWQFHRNDMLVFQLRGRGLWKTKAGPVKSPLRCFHPHSRRLEDAEEVVKVNRLGTLDKRALVSLAPPFDERHIFEIDDGSSDSDDGESIREDILQPGSVIYLPRGRWFEAEVVDERSLWLEVHLIGSTYEERMISGIRQLLWHDEEWRTTISTPQSGQVGTDRAKSAHRHMAKLLKDLKAKFEALQVNDILPDYLASDSLVGITVPPAERDKRSTAAETQVEVDLTKPDFRPKNVKIFKDALYRVNPVALLLGVDEIPHVPAVSDEPPASQSSAEAAVNTKHRVLQRKTKRTQTMRVFSQQNLHEYVLHEAFGNDRFQSQLRAKFRCSDAQAAMVEWLRTRGAEPFHAEDLGRGSQAASLPRKGAGRSEETARKLLRFLVYVGYISHVEPPTKHNVGEL